MQVAFFDCANLQCKCNTMKSSWFTARDCGQFIENDAFLSEKVTLSTNRPWKINEILFLSTAPRIQTYFFRNDLFCQLGEYFFKDSFLLQTTKISVKMPLSVCRKLRHGRPCLPFPDNYSIIFCLQSVVRNSSRTAGKFYQNAG